MRVLNGVPGPRYTSETHQTFRPGVNDTNEQETDWEPMLGILNVEISKGYYSQLLDECNTGAANS